MYVHVKLLNTITSETRTQEELACNNGRERSGLSQITDAQRVAVNNDTIGDVTLLINPTIQEQIVKL